MTLRNKGSFPSTSLTEPLRIARRHRSVDLHHPAEAYGETRFSHAMMDPIDTIIRSGAGVATRHYRMIEPCCVCNTHLFVLPHKFQLRRERARRHVFDGTRFVLLFLISCLGLCDGVARHALWGVLFSRRARIVARVFVLEALCAGVLCS